MARSFGRKRNTHSGSKRRGSAIPEGQRFVRRTSTVRRTTARDILVMSRRLLEMLEASPFNPAKATICINAILLNKPETPQTVTEVFDPAIRVETLKLEMHAIQATLDAGDNEWNRQQLTEQVRAFIATLELWRAELRLMPALKPVV
ncbi:MAG: hypothetical protein Q7R83_00830 [bacterium]|nr:hypothetical protein [bacterium]